MKTADEKLDEILYEAGRVMKNLIQKEMESIYLRQKIEDITSIFIFEQLFSDGRIKVKELKTLKKALEESDNPWLKKELCDILCDEKYNYTQGGEVNREKVFGQIKVITDETKEAREKSFPAELRLIRLWHQNPDHNKKR